MENKLSELDEKFDGRLKILEDSSDEYYDSKESDLKKNSEKKKKHKSSRSKSQYSSSIAK